MPINPLNLIQPGKLSKLLDNNTAAKNMAKAAAVAAVSLKGHGAVPDAIAAMASRTEVRKKTNTMVQVLSATASAPAKVEDLIKPVAPAATATAQTAVTFFRVPGIRRLDIRG